MSNDTPTRDETGLPPEDDPDVQDVIDRLGGLADVDTAQRIVAANRADDEDEDDSGSCELCGENDATQLGVLVVNTRAYPATPLCDECYIPIDDLGLPADVDREEFIEMHERMCETETVPA